MPGSGQQTDSVFNFFAVPFHIALASLNAADLVQGRAAYCFAQHVGSILIGLQGTQKMHQSRMSICKAQILQVAVWQ